MTQVEMNKKEAELEMLNYLEETVNTIEIEFEIDEIFVLLVLAKTLYNSEMSSNFFRNYHSNLTSIKKWLENAIDSLPQKLNNKTDMEHLKYVYRGECVKNKMKWLEKFWFTLENTLKDNKQIGFNVDIIKDIVNVIPNAFTVKDFSSVEFAVKKEALLPEIHLR